MLANRSALLVSFVLSRPPSCAAVVCAVQGRKKNASATGVTVAGVASAAAQAQAVAKKDTTHANFYRFQQREKRRSGGSFTNRLHNTCLHPSRLRMHPPSHAELRSPICLACRAAGLAAKVRAGQEADCRAACLAQVEAVLMPTILRSSCNMRCRNAFCIGGAASETRHMCSRASCAATH